MPVITRTEVIARSENPKDSIGKSIGVGFAAGIIGGLVMSLILMITTAATGAGFWYFPKMVMGVFMGVDALIGGADIILLGLVTHFLVAAGWGIVFSLLTRRLTELGPILTAGLIFGLAVWLIMTYAVLPWANPVMAARVAVVPLTWMIVHLGFGAGLVMEVLFKESRETAVHRGKPRTYSPA